MRRIVVLLALIGSVSCNPLGTEGFLSGPDIVFVVQPSATRVGTIMAPAVQVELRDHQGRTIASYPQPIIVQLQDGPTGAVLQGTVSRSIVNGRAIFNDLKVDRAASGYRLTASPQGGTAVTTSASFTITP